MNLKNLEKEHLKFLKIQSTEYKIESKKKTESSKRINTIVVPAHELGFKNVFLEKNCWYSVQLKDEMIHKIKYIAVYQTSPISAITYYAKVLNIELYKNTGKYIIYFKNKPIKIKSIQLDKDKRYLSLQKFRYTNIDKLLNAKKLSEAFY